MHGCAFGSVLVLASEDEETDSSASDSRVLTTLLLVRDIRAGLLQAWSEVWNREPCRGG